MRYNFCTLFDSAFLARGLALYHSLEQTGNDFHLYVYAFDDTSCEVLRRLKLSRATIIPLEEFEDAELVRVKPYRSRAEYCWTSTPSIILHAIQKFGLPMCTYLDADLYFFASPAPIFDELGNDSILLIEHHYPAGREKDLLYGKYCVQFNTFRNDERGMQALQWWRDRCIEWCSIVPEDGKFGDQKYLDDWTTRFSGVHELKHLGGGVAPWNDSQYRFFEKDDRLFGRDKDSDMVFPIIFYHFHRTLLYRILGRLRIKSAYLDVNKNASLQKLLYRRYRSALAKALSEIHRIDPHIPTPFGTIQDYLRKTIRDHAPKFIAASLKKIGLRMDY